MANEKNAETLDLCIPSDTFARIVTAAKTYPKNSPVELDISCIQLACEIWERGFYASRPAEFWEKLAAVALLRLSVDAPADPNTVHTVEV